MKYCVKSNLILLLLIFSISAQKHPFPQNIKYPYGFLPAEISSEHQAAWYKSYDSAYIKSCSGGYRPGVDPLDKSLVEAQGWCMITAAYMGEKEKFDGFYKFYKSKCTNQAGGMMAWKTTCDGFVDQGSATDGDLDVAFSLIVAHWQWPEDGYLEKAKSVLSNCKKLIVDCSGVSALGGGYAGSRWGGCDVTDISYYTPAFFRVFAEVTNDEAWSKLADDTYTVLNNCANKTTGLVPDWHSFSGQAGAGGRNGTFRYDACRVPWRIALDYLWNGNQKALDWCKKVSSWAHNEGPGNIYDEYNLNGNKVGSNKNMAFLGSFAVSAMCNSQEVVDDFAEEVLKKKSDYWYSGYLGNCYLLTLSGNMWREDMLDTRSVPRFSGKRTDSPDIRIQYNAKKMFISGLAEKSNISLKDFCGRNVSSAKFTGNNMVSIDIAGLTDGCYIIQVVTPSKSSSLRKIVSIVK